MLDEINDVSDFLIFKSRRVFLLLSQNSFLKQIDNDASCQPGLHNQSLPNFRIK